MRSCSLASSASAISATCPPDSRRMSTGTETHLRASSHLRSCQIARVLFQRDHAVPVTQALFHELLRTTRGCRRQHTVQSFHTSCPVSLFLLAPLQYPVCSLVNEQSIRHTFARAEQHTHSVHLRSLIWTSRHHQSPLHSVLQLEETVFPLHSRHISREMHISARVQRTTPSSPTIRKPVVNNQVAPLPSGKLGTTSEGFPHSKRVRVDET